jgi:hypothetical protein
MLAGSTAAAAAAAAGAAALNSASSPEIVRLGVPEEAALLPQDGMVRKNALNCCYACCLCSFVCRAVFTVVDHKLSRVNTSTIFIHDLE